MSNKRYDLCSPRPRKDSDKPFWHRVGTAFENDKGITLLFDSLPLPDDEGRVAVMLFEPKPREDNGQKRGNNNNFATDLDDDIAF